jgi:hypothetical protein
MAAIFAQLQDLLRRRGLKFNHSSVGMATKGRVLGSGLGPIGRFTRWVRHRRLCRSRIRCWCLYLNRRECCGNHSVIRRMPVKGGPGQKGSTRFA